MARPSDQLNSLPKEFDAVVFDLLSALIDSWSLWDDVAGDSALGRKWRNQFLAAAAETKGYRPYLALVGEAALAVDESNSLAGKLEGKWAGLEPWPEAATVVSRLGSQYKLGVASNCSEYLGIAAAERIGATFDVLVTAERAGYYKPDPRIYRMVLDELETEPDRTLFVAGSPFDVIGAADLGMPVYWHNRIGLINESATSIATKTGNSLTDLLKLID